MVVENLAEFRGKALALKQIGDAQRAARHFILVGRTYAAAGGADGVGALRLLARTIERHMRGQYQGARGAHPQPIENRHALPDQHFALL